MIGKLYCSYQYYYFRLYLFYLKQWNNHIERAKFATTFIILVSNVSKIALFSIIIILLFKPAAQSPLDLPRPSASVLSSTALTIIIITVAVLMTVNHVLLFSKHREISAKFNKVKDKTNYTKKGWLILCYALGPFLTFFLLAYFW